MKSDIQYPLETRSAPYFKSGAERLLKTSKLLRSTTMPKLNARENTRNRAQAKKRERNRLLRTTVAPVAAKAAKPKAKTAAKPKPAAASPAATK
jgi:hypothetical protein